MYCLVGRRINRFHGLRQPSTPLRCIPETRIRLPESLPHQAQVQPRLHILPHAAGLSPAKLTDGRGYDKRA